MKRNPIKERKIAPREVLTCLQYGCSSYEVQVCQCLRWVEKSALVSKLQCRHHGVAAARIHETKKLTLDVAPASDLHQIIEVDTVDDLADRAFWKAVGHY